MSNLPARASLRLVARRLVCLAAAGCLFILAGRSLAAPVPAGWPLEVLSWDLTRAYPGLLYEWRLGIKGGVYPYTFTLLEGPSGMTVDARKGILRWLAPAAASAGNKVSVKVVDSAGESLTHSYSIDVKSDGFFFVAADSTASDSNPGSKDQPWRTIQQAQTAAGTGIVYLRAGTYPAAGMELKGSNANKWLAYPGDKVILDLGGETIGLGKSESVIAGLEIRNAGAKMFWMGGTPKNVIWRNNVMHGVHSTSANNPSFLFFEDGDFKPVEGRVQYDRIVVQENTFYDQRNNTGHGGSLVAYNVKNLLFEDNLAYDLDGAAVSDKDDGYYNTFRNNVFYDSRGLMLASQYTQAQIEVSHNLIYGCKAAITIGAQPGYIRDIFVHHNTFVGAPIAFGSMTDCAECTNYNIYRNIIVNDPELLYNIYPVKIDSGYRYPRWCTEAGRAAIDDNLLWTTGPHVAGYSWGLTNRSLADWQAWGFDLGSVSADPGLDAEYRLPAESPYLGEYGRDLPPQASTPPAPPSGLKLVP